ncbi:hypothetical protein [Thalassospira alkalitolerans]|uniref:hypothetical protein n=1 Tax=Thalassospira alkalitolerans TaxID=1293890 RepID=UPI003AA96737
MRGLTTIVIVMSFFAIYGHGKTVRAQPEQPLNVIYPLRVEAEKGPHDFILATLKLVLDKSEIPYKMRPTSIPMQQTRAMERLKDGKDVTIYWAGTSPEFETEFLPIRIPIMRGLLGYRLMIIRKDRQKIFDTIMTLSQLAPLHAGQGLGWADIEILKNAGLSVTAAPYEHVFKLINAGRLDYFPRGITEAFPEIREFGPENPDITVEENLVLVYPFAMFFFVNKDNPELANAVTLGFQKAYEDGSFLALFARHPHIRAIIDQAHLSQRTRIDIANPFLTTATKEIPARYWYQADKIFEAPQPHSPAPGKKANLTD